MKNGNRNCEGEKGKIEERKERWRVKTYLISVADMHIQTRMVYNSIGEYTFAEIITSLEKPVK